MANMVTFTCRQCGEENSAPLSQGGNRANCNYCGAENPVAVPQGVGAASSASATPRPGTIKIGCALCGHRQYVPASLAGKPIQCEQCGKKIRVPGARPAASPAPASPPARATTARDGGHATARRPAVARSAEPPAQREKIGAVSTPPAPQDVPLDLFDDESGSGEVGPLEPDVEPLPLSPRGSFQPARQPQAADAVESPVAAPKKKKKKKKSTYGLNADDVKTIGWAIIGLTVIVGGAAIALPGVRSTIGLTMIVVGGLVMLLGNAGFASVVREEGAMHYLLCRYFPLYSLYFLVTRWDRMRDHVMLATVGTVILAPGILIFSIAPDVKKDMGEGDDEDKPAASRPAKKDAGQPPMPVKQESEDEEG